MTERDERKNTTENFKNDPHLLDLIREYSNQFEDMLFAEDSFTYPYVAIQDTDIQGENYNGTAPLPDGFTFFSYCDFFRFKVEKIGKHSDGCINNGKFEYKRGEPLEIRDVKDRPLLTIDPSVMNLPYDQGTESEQYKEAEKKRKVVILHEMIHLHELVFDQVPSFYRDTYLWALYNHLKPLIPDLDERINWHAQLPTQQAILRKGGEHNILFLMKSYDLDLKNNYELGTVFDYQDENGEPLFFEKISDKEEK